MDRRSTAIHDAGHAVARIRLCPNGYHRYLTIIPEPSTGAAGVHSAKELAFSPDEKDLERNRERAQEEVICCCAGYAALVVAGYGEEQAVQDCWSDFEQAQELIELWKLDPLADQRKLVVEYVSEPKNIRAVKRLAQELLFKKLLVPHEIPAIVALADGESTVEDLENFRLLFSDIEEQRSRKIAHRIREYGG